MSEPWVTRATIIGGQLLLTVQVDEFVAGESLEISGYATQHGGALATAFDIQNVIRNRDGSATMYVTAKSSQAFQEGYDITVVLRAARVWMTVLRQQGEPPTGILERPPAEEGTVWDSVRATGWETVSGSPTWIAGGTPAASGPSFQTE
jgi:hypothetical protein